MYTTFYINVYFREADPNDTPVSHFIFSSFNAYCQNKICNNKFAIVFGFRAFHEFKISPLVYY